MRTPTPRPPGEHLATVSRVLRQVAIDNRMSRQRRKKILDALLIAQTEFEKEMMK